MVRRHVLLNGLSRLPGYPLDVVEHSGTGQFVYVADAVGGITLEGGEARVTSAAAIGQV